MSNEPEYSTPDEENPEWTRERMASAMRYPNLPPELMRIIEADKKKRGPQKAAKKEAISIRLSPDVLDALRATGPGGSLEQMMHCERSSFPNSTTKVGRSAFPVLLAAA